MEVENNLKIYKSVEENSNEIKELKMLIKDLNIKINKKEDDIKNIINEKDEIIKELSNKILKQKKKLKKNNNDIICLNKKIEELMNEFRNKYKEKENKFNKINENILKEKNLLLKDINNKYNELKREINSINSDIIENKNIISKNFGKTNVERMNIIFVDSKHNQKILEIEYGTTVGEMIKKFQNQIGNKCICLYGAKILGDNNSTKIEEMFDSGARILYRCQFK